MFYVVEMTDTVKIEPWLFNVNRADAISVALNKKLANKVSSVFKLYTSTVYTHVQVVSSFC